MIRHRYGHYTGTAYFKKDGNIVPKEVKFSRDFRGRYLNNAVCTALCCNETAVLYNIMGNNGQPYAIRVTLQEMVDRNGEKYISVEKNGYIPNIPYETKASALKTVTVKQAADTIISLLIKIYEATAEDDDAEIDFSKYIRQTYDELSANTLSVYAMREYPEAITVRNAAEIMKYAIEEMINGQILPQEEIYNMLREDVVNWIKVNFEDDEPARANGFAAEKPARANTKYLNKNCLKSMYEGEWMQRKISFERSYYGTYITDNECERLCKGETVNIKIDETRNFDVILKEINANGFLKIQICNA